MTSTVGSAHQYSMFTTHHQAIYALKYIVVASLVAEDGDEGVATSKPMPSACAALCPKRFD